MLDHRTRLSVLGVGLVLTLTSACEQQVAGEAVAAVGEVATTAKPSSRPLPRSSSRPSRSDPTTAPRSSAAPAAALAGLAGVWVGEYTCGQGNTGLTLTISQPAGGTVPAVFEFFPLPSNPAAKAGSYSMVGSLAAGGALVFKQERWIKQPSGYVMVDLKVTSPLTADVTALRGDVLDPACTEFSLRRR